MLLSRVRVEEKLLMETMDRLQMPYRQIDDRELVFDLADPQASPFAEVDVVLERCLSFSRASYALRVLNGWGIPTVNTAPVVNMCGDKLLTTQALLRAGVSSPRTLLAFTPESALRPSRRWVIPACSNRPSGSWGRFWHG